MSKQSGLGDHFYVAGFDLSGDVSSVDAISGPLATIDVTAINSYGNQRIGGLRDGDMQFTSFFNVASGAEHPALSALPRTNVVASYFRGTTLGNASACINGRQVNYDGTRDNTGNLTLKVEVQASGFGLEWGTQLTPGLRTDTAATAGTLYDSGAASSFGCQAYVQVLAFTGTDCTIVIKSSADGSAFSSPQTEASLAVGTPPQASRLVGANSSVNRYWKAGTTTTGGFSSITFAVTLVKNQVAVSF